MQAPGGVAGVGGVAACAHSITPPGVSLQHALPGADGVTACAQAPGDQPSSVQLRGRAGGDTGEAGWVRCADSATLEPRVLRGPLWIKDARATSVHNMMLGPEAI